MFVAAFFRSDLTLASAALSRWLRKSGMAIAARMPMITMTTRSSMRVKPWSFSSRDFFRRLSMVFLLIEWGTGAGTRGGSRYNQVVGPRIAALERVLDFFSGTSSASTRPDER